MLGCSCPNTMMVEMSDDIGELLSALFKLEALQLRLGITAAEAMPTFGGGANQPIGALNNAMPSGCGAGYRSETDRRSRIRLSMPAACEFFGRRHSGCGPRCSGGGARHRIGRASYHPAAMFRSCAGRRFRCTALEGGRRRLVKAATPDRAIRCWHGLGVRAKGAHPSQG